MSKISQQVKAASKDFDKKKIKISTLIEQLGHKTIGLALLLCALPNLIPFANVVGITWVLAPLLIMFSLQLMFHAGQPWLPSRLLSKTVDSRKIKDLSDKSLPYLKQFERAFSQRLVWLFNPITESLVGLICALLSVIMLIPLLPFGDSFPSLFISLYAISLIQRDGLLLLISFSATVLTIGGLYQFWLEAIQAFIA